MQKSILLCLVMLSLLSSGQLLASLDPSTLSSAGEKAFAANDFTGAAENFAQALKYSPEDLRARFRYGQALYSLNRYSESHNQFQAILQNSPNNIIARVYLAENLMQLKRNQEARTHVEWILKVQPEHERAQQILSALNSGRAAFIEAPEKMPQGVKPVPMKVAKSAKPAKPGKSPAPAKSVIPANSVISAAVADPGKEFVARPFIAQPAPEQKTKSKVTPTGKIINQPAVVAARPVSPLAPRAVSNVSSFAVAGFLQAARESFIVNLEQAKFLIESGDTVSAAAHLGKADELARNSNDNRRFLEVQILKSLVYLYSRDYKAFGQHLMTLKSVLSKESYQSFLDIYNQGSTMKDTCDQARLSAGVAMGAGHYAVAAALFAEAFKKYPNDPLISHFLADAQIQNLDYRGAEATLAHLARTDNKSAEAYFNLARFYLTVYYKPEQARSYAVYAANLKPEDARISILLSLLDYTEGKISEGMTRIRELLPKVEDPSIQAICKKIMSDGQLADATQGGNKVNFASILALPGAPHAPVDSYRLLGEDYLKRGSIFTALKFFTAAQDVAEIGRAYLGLASSLNAAGESEMSALASGYGLKALEQELAGHPQNSRAHLYLALYHFERGDKVAARKSIEAGLAANGESVTRQRLTAILNNINNS